MKISCFELWRFQHRGHPIEGSFSFGSGDAIIFDIIIFIDDNVVLSHFEARYMLVLLLDHYGSTMLLSDLHFFPT